MASGSLSLADALLLLHVRGPLLELLDEPGAMLLVDAPLAAIVPCLGAGVEIAAFNGPQSHGVAGPVAAIDALARRLDGEGIAWHLIRYGAASHCRLVEPVLGRFQAALARCALRAPVRFAEAVCAVAAEGPLVFVEIGPQTGLAHLIKSNVADANVICLGQHASDPRDGRLALLDGIGALWVHGAAIAFHALDAGTWRDRRPVPGLDADSVVAVPELEAGRACSDVEFVVRGVWQELFGQEAIGLRDNFFGMGGHSLLAVRINSALHTLFSVRVPRAVQFGSPTVHGLAGALVATGAAAGVDVGAIATTLREVSAMSDEDMARLMQEQPA